MASCAMLSSTASSFANMSFARAAAQQRGSTQHSVGIIRRFSGLKPAPCARVTCISSYKAAATKAPLTIVCESTTIAKVQEIIASQLSVDLASIQPHTTFSDLGADSLDTVEIVMAIEEKFGVSISEESAEKISNVQQVADLIEKQKVAS